MTEDDDDATGATGVAALSSPTTALTAAVALAATAASVEGLAELLRATAALSVPASWAIGSVIDLAVIVLALQAREAVVSGRGGHLEMALTWAASIASGVASASWQIGHVSPQAAAVRLLLPLTAACLWHLSVVGTRAAADARPARRQSRASRLALRLAFAQADAAGRGARRRGSWRERRAQRAYLRHMALTSLDAQGHGLDWWRTQVAQVTNTATASPGTDGTTGDHTAPGDTPPPADATGDDDTTGGDSEVTGGDVELTGRDDGLVPQPDVPTAPADAGTGAPTPRASSRQLVADALRQAPGATSRQVHAMLGGACSLRTVQRHVAAIQANGDDSA